MEELQTKSEQIEKITELRKLLQNNLRKKNNNSIDLGDVSKWEKIPTERLILTQLLAKEFDLNLKKEYLHLLKNNSGLYSLILGQYYQRKAIEEDLKDVAENIEILLQKPGTTIEDLTIYAIKTFKTIPNQKDIENIIKEARKKQIKLEEVAQETNNLKSKERKFLGENLNELFEVLLDPYKFDVEEQRRFQKIISLTSENKFEDFNIPEEESKKQIKKLTKKDINGKLLEHFSKLAQAYKNKPKEIIQTVFPTLIETITIISPFYREFRDRVILETLNLAELYQNAPEEINKQIFENIANICYEGERLVTRLIHGLSSEGVLKLIDLYSDHPAALQEMFSLIIKAATSKNLTVFLNVTNIAENLSSESVLKLAELYKNKPEKTIKKVFNKIGFAAAHSREDMFTLTNYYARKLNKKWYKF